MHTLDTAKINEAQIADTKTSIDLVPSSDHDAYFFRSLEEERSIKLNQPQIEAVRHFQGPALILAGAGSGKTSVLTSRAGYLISFHRVKPSHILLVTFTRKAADEMKERIALLPDLTRKMVNDITVGTFHSIFLRLLRSQGYNQDILSNEKYKLTKIKIILKQMNLQDSYEAETLLSILSAYKLNMKSVQDLPELKPIDREIKQVLIEYEEWKTANHYFDFDDILLESYHLLLNNERVLKALQDRFTYIMCDEWQDTNPIQYNLIQLLAAPENNLFCVGDDDQTIYSFNGADSSIILDFDKSYPTAKVITLDVNYRSNTNIVGLANDVIALNHLRRPKVLKATKRSSHKPYFLQPNNSNEEAELIVDNILRAVQSGARSLSDYAILHRTVAASRAIFDKLVSEGIPFVTYSKGDTFYEHSIVAPVIDHLRLSLDPLNFEALERILPSLYLNREKTMEYVQAHLQIRPNANPLTLLIHLPGLQAFQQQQIKERMTLISKLMLRTPLAAIKEICTIYTKHLNADERKSITYDKEIVLETLSEIEDSAKAFKTVREYLQFVDHIIEKNKQMDVLRRNPDFDAIHLMTIHMSKGLEFPVVYLIGAIEDILPHRSALEADKNKDVFVQLKGAEKKEKALEEERRLMYVAITRAMEELHISSPKYFRGKEAEVSRFLVEPYKVKEETAVKTGTQSGYQSKNIKVIRKELQLTLVWDCVNPDCNAWMRITNNEDQQIGAKKCPMCRSDMKKVNKMV